MKKNKKIFLFSVIISTFLVLFLGIGLLIPGMGLQSEKFINSIKSEITKYLPNNKVVINKEALDTQIPLSRTTLNDELQSAYENDCLSTLAATQALNDDIYNTYKREADQVYEINLQKNEAVNNGNVDMYDFSMQLLDFDLMVAKTNGFNTNAIDGYGFVSTGLAWIFHGGINELFNSKNSSAYSLAKQYSIISDQIVYDNSIKLQNTQNIKFTETTSNYGTDIYDITQLPVIVKSDFPSIISIVNNKIWFFNLQLRTLITACILDNLLTTQNKIFVNDSNTIQYFNNKIGKIPVKSVVNQPTQYEIKLIAPLTTNDLFQPNFVKAFHMATIGAIIFVSVFPLIGIDIIYIIISYNLFDIKIKNKFLKLKVNKK